MREGQGLEVCTETASFDFMKAGLILLNSTYFFVHLLVLIIKSRFHPVYKSSPLFDMWFQCVTRSRILLNYTILYDNRTLRIVPGYQFS